MERRPLACLLVWRAAAWYPLTCLLGARSWTGYGVGKVVVRAGEVRPMISFKIHAPGARGMACACLQVCSVPPLHRP